MQVFISWSGKRSQRVAELLADWIKVVVQASKPWVSTELDRGSNWVGEISAALSSTNVGVLCVTAANANAPWLLFEAGALAKGLAKSRVIPLLIDLQPTDLGMPLSQFNATSCTREGIAQLVHTVNRATDEPLPQEIVETSIAAHWVRFETRLSEILATTESPEPVIPRSDGDKLDEVLSLVHGLSGRIQRLEKDQVTPSAQALAKALLIHQSATADPQIYLSELAYTNQTRHIYPRSISPGGTMTGGNVADVTDVIPSGDGQG